MLGIAFSIPIKTTRGVDHFAIYLPVLIAIYLPVLMMSD